jgi:hypothetical protein
MGYLIVRSKLLSLRNDLWSFLFGFYTQSMSIASEAIIFASEKTR